MPSTASRGCAMPDWSAEIRARLAHLSLTPEREAEIAEELEEHLSELYGELRAQGLSSDDARARALSELADHESLARALRSVETIDTPRPIPTGTSNRGSLLA